jgi:hypothetical protein
MLGETGTDYICFFEEDEGNREWQAADWKGGGCPNALKLQVNAMVKKGRHVTYFTYGPCGEWFVAG